ncbi:MAG: formylglycine-generating enzyme family protein, partial [Gemmataceae bacterium]
MKVVAGYQALGGYRLPTDAEWEYACRGGAATQRCYGDATDLLSRYAWYAANTEEARKPVGQLLPNAFGLFDMHGNVVEWCQDPRSTPGFKLPAPGEEEAVASAMFRAVRGGHVNSYQLTIRSAKQFGDRPTTNDAGGFRPVRTRR